MTWNSSDGARTVYLNGTPATSPDAISAGTAWINGGVWQIGRDTCCSNRVFDGLIDDAGIWTRALSEREIGKIYRAGLMGIDQAHAAVIPEPSTFVLAALGLLCLALHRRRRRPCSSTIPSFVSLPRPGPRHRVGCWDSRIASGTPH